MSVVAKFVPVHVRVTVEPTFTETVDGDNVIVTADNKPF